jgi:HEAT repeat protein
MFFHSWTRWLPLTGVVATVLGLVVASGSLAGAETRPSPTEGWIFDLKHPDPDRRRIAARELGLARTVAATPDLVALARDPNASVRREVEQSLEQMEDIRALPAFVQFTDDDEVDIRDRAVQAMVNLYLPRNTGPGALLVKLGNLINPWSDEESDTVIEPDISVDAAVVPALRGRVSDPENKVRRRAARALGILRGEAAVPDLIRALREDRDNEVRFEAVRALRKIADPSVGDVIMPLLNLNNDRVRNEIIATVGSLRCGQAVGELTRVFEQAKPGDRSRSMSLSALADIADPSSRSLFESVKADKDETIRLYANEGLARTGDSTLKTVTSADRLSEKSSRVRAAQAFALLRMGQVEFLDELIRELGSPATRPLAKEYLVETQPSERPTLFAGRAEKPVVRAELADVFGLMGDPAALPALQELARDPDGAVARAADRAIRRINAVNRAD